MILSGNKVLCMGDSITYDTVAPTDGAYRYYLEPKLKTYFRINEISWCGDDVAAGKESSGNKMCGASGQRVDEILSTYSPGAQVARWRPDLVIIHLGTNDMTQFTSGAWPTGSIAISIANYSTLLDTIFAAHPNCVVAACKIIPNTGASDSNITQFNSELGLMCSRHPYASRIFNPDLNAKFKTNGTWAADYMFDATHPNTLGKSTMADGLNESIQANFTVPPRFPANIRRSIRPHLSSLKYKASTGTILGTSDTLDTSRPWAVSFDMNLIMAKNLATNQGFLCLKTDQGHPFIFLGLKGTNNRYIEFGAWTSSPFGRFFANVSSEINVYKRLSDGWHQLMFTYDGVSRSSATSYKFYIDGIPVNVVAGSGLSSSTNQNGIGVAVAGGVAGTFYMSNLTIWNGGPVLSADDVRDFFVSSRVSGNSIVIRNYKHDDQSGATLTDSKGIQNGSIGTASWITDSATKLRSAATSRTAATSRADAA